MWQNLAISLGLVLVPCLTVLALRPLLLRVMAWLLSLGGQQLVPETPARRRRMLVSVGITACIFWLLTFWLLQLGSADTTQDAGAAAPPRPVAGPQACGVQGAAPWPAAALSPGAGARISARAHAARKLRLLRG
jgi:hypothetical protein